jgi:hypothetical protein
MKSHEIKSLSVEEPSSLQELAAPDGAEAATRGDEFDAQWQKIQRLNEYCDEAVAEIRASLDRT